MRRLLCLAVFSLPGLGVVVAPGVAAADPKIPLSARTTACTTGAAPGDRAVAFTGSMPALSGTKRMMMRFALLQRRGTSGTFVPVNVPGWSWQKSDPGRPGLVFTERVDGLAAPAGYRATITFRWLDRRGHVQREVRRTTGVCEQPDPRPDLAFDALAAVPKDDTTAFYTLGVRNDGRSPAPAFAATLTIGDTVVGPLAFEPLAPDAHDEQTILGPRCAPGSTVTVRLDPGNQVDEPDETDNVVQRPCPLG
jgi:CARDB